MSDVGQNPYAPPKAVVADVAVDDGVPAAAVGPLYSLNQITTAAFLGSAVAGAWLMATNFRKLGQPQLARRTIWLGIGTTAALLGLSFMLPDRFPSSPLPLAVTFGTRMVAERLFRTTFKAQEQAGIAWISWWRVVGISLLIMVILIAVLFAGVFGYELATSNS